jgi:sulfhydrogenase subunit alpha
MSAERTRRFQVEALTRVEGEGGLHVEIRDGEVSDVRLRIFEPPRFFEAFLRGRSIADAPDLTARICGICPVAYQMSACQALEALCGVEVDEPIRSLRHLLYCGEWIESHMLHVHMLHAPDFLGYENGIAMAADHREQVELGLVLKQLGNEIVEVVGGRAVHPVNVRLGGFYRAPDAAAMSSLADRLRPAVERSVDVVRWTAGLPMPDHALPHDAVLMALRHPSEYPMLGDRLIGTNGLDLAPHEFADHVVEEHVEHSTALHGRLRTGEPYLVGPLARFALNSDRLAPRAAAVAEEVGIGPEERNPFRSIVVRAIETVHAFETALEIAEGYRTPHRAAVPLTMRAGAGSGWSEAPRGVLWHRYEADPEGRITGATIVPPTSQNQPMIERDLTGLIHAMLDRSDDEIESRCEQAVRNYDPCISCATHFLRLRIDRR